jgi:hypothetical protein
VMKFIASDNGPPPSYLVGHVGRISGVAMSNNAAYFPL